MSDSETDSLNASGWPLSTMRWMRPFLERNTSKRASSTPVASRNAHTRDSPSTLRLSSSQLSETNSTATFSG